MNNSARLFTRFELPTPHGLRELLKKGKQKMTNEISIYNFNQNQVRTQLINSNPWFCLKDVCDILDIKNITILKQRLNPKGLSQTKLLTKGGTQKVYIVNEPNLYKVIFRSDKSIARDFENWVCEEVLPSIRKTGSYIANTEATVEVSPYTRRLPSGKKEIVLSEKARSEIGGIVKACCGVAIREALSNLIKVYENETPVKTEWPAEADQSLKGVAEAIVDYGRSEYSRGKIEGILKATFDENYQQMGKSMSIKAG